MPEEIATDLTRVSVIPVMDAWNWLCGDSGACRNWSDHGKETKKARHSIRLKGHDYGAPGAYFVTLCTVHRHPIFGRLKTGAVRLNKFGLIARDYIHKITKNTDNIRADEFMVMPDHIHLIVIIGPQDDEQDTIHYGASPPPPAGPIAPNPQHGPESRSLGTIIGSYKSAVTRSINKLSGRSGGGLWLRNYYEIIIPDEQALQRIRRYIRNNPRPGQPIAALNQGSSKGEASLSTKPQTRYRGGVNSPARL